MKKILCFGDSNTYGFNPQTGGRFDKNERWTGVLQTLAGSDYAITEAGCNNRTCFRDNFEGKKFTGYQILPEYLSTKYDLVVLWIGSNDLQRQYNVCVEEIQYGIENLIEIVRSIQPDTEILIIPPMVIGKEVLASKIFSFLFDENSIEKSLLVCEIYRKTALKYNCNFLNFDGVITPSLCDGLHFEACEHQKIANIVYKEIENIFNY